MAIPSLPLNTEKVVMNLSPKAQKTHPFTNTLLAMGKRWLCPIRELCFGKQQLARSLPLPQRHNSLLQLEKAFSLSSLL